MTRSQAEGTGRLLVLSSGSWDSSIVDRNAFDRLEASRIVELFPQTDYVFFRTPESSVREVGDGLTIYEVAGREPPRPWSRIKWIRRLALLWSGLREIEGIASANPPSAVLCVDPFLIGLMALRLARRRRVPMVLSLVSHYRASYRAGGVKPVAFLPIRVSFMIEDWVLRRADLVLVHCDFYGQYAVERGAPEARVRKFPCYADATFYETSPDPDIWRRLNVDDPAPLVYVGRMSPEKYSIDLVRCFAAVRKVFPERMLVVVGGAGPQRDEALAEAEKLGVADAIKIVEDLRMRDILSTMAGASVLLAPHAGYALLESALAGAPIVAYDFEWHPEIVEHGVTGLLVPYRDWKAMADATVSLLRDPARAKGLGAAARERCLRENRKEHTLASVAESYRLVVGGS